MPGIICLDRDHFFSSPFWKEERTYNKSEAHIDLYQRAAHSPHSQLVAGKLIHLKIGEQTASERYLEKRWNWSRTKVRSFLQILREIGEINQRKDQGETILILCKYKDVTHAPGKKEPATRPREDQARTRDEPKDKELEEGKEREPRRPPAQQSPFADEMPTDAANDLQSIADRINSIAPPWKRRPTLSYQERMDLMANSKAFHDLEDRDWQLLAAYLPAEIPEEIGKFFQPNQRSMFIKSISDILQHADRWAASTKWKAAP